MRNDAFTLMEMMLALAVSAIALAGIGSVFYSAVHLRERTAAMLDEAGPLQHALQILRRDLQGAVPPGGSYSLAGDFKIQSASGGAGQQSLQLFSCTDAIGENAPWGDVQEIIYALRPATNAAQGAGMDLFRTVTRNLLATVVEPEDQWLLGKVQSLEVAGYDGADWRDSWDTSQANTNLPTAVRVRIQTAAETRAGGLSQQPFEMIVPLDAQSRTNQVQSASQ